MKKGKKKAKTKKKRKRFKNSLEGFAIKGEDVSRFTSVCIVSLHYLTI